MSQAMRPGLKWALSITLLATGVALLWTRAPVVEATAAAEGRGSAPVPRAPSTSGAVAPRHVESTRAVSASLAGPVASGSDAGQDFDPFAGVVPPPPPPAPVQLAVTPPPPAPPPPPAQDYRFLGRVTGPDGTQQILLSRGDSVVPISVGTALDNGYVVESIHDDSVVLVHPASGGKAVVSLAAAPQ